MQHDTVYTRGNFENGLAKPAVSRGFGTLLGLLRKAASEEVFISFSMIV